MKWSPSQWSKHLYSTAALSPRHHHHHHHLLRLVNPDLKAFREQAFAPEIPCLLPQSSLAKSLPALDTWFKKDADGLSALDAAYLSRFGSTPVPLEMTGPAGTELEFVRVQRPLSDYLELSNGFNIGGTDEKGDKGSRVQVYLAQCPLTDLPSELQADLPTPEFVRSAGRGDVYDSSIWLGYPPTYTPLHRDPNPNMFIQLSGVKEVRIFEPWVGHDIFLEVQRSANGSASPFMRGEEIMKGKERSGLEAAVWNTQSDVVPPGYAATLRRGDALFIPKGWWHSVKGTGEGFVGSVNWWFR